MKTLVFVLALVVAFVVSADAIRFKSRLSLKGGIDEAELCKKFIVRGNSGIEPESLCSFYDDNFENFQACSNLAHKYSAVFRAIQGKDEKVFKQICKNADMSKTFKTVKGDDGDSTEFLPELCSACPKPDLPDPPICKENQCNQAASFGDDCANAVKAVKGWTNPKVFYEQLIPVTKDNEGKYSVKAEKDYPVRCELSEPETCTEKGKGVLGNVCDTCPKGYTQDDQIPLIENKLLALKNPWFVNKLAISGLDLVERWSTEFADITLKQNRCLYVPASIKQEDKTEASKKCRPEALAAFLAWITYDPTFFVDRTRLDSGFLTLPVDKFPRLKEAGCGPVTLRNEMHVLKMGTSNHVQFYEATDVGLVYVVFRGTGDSDFTTIYDDYFNSRATEKGKGKEPNGFYEWKTNIAAQYWWSKCELGSEQGILSSYCKNAFLTQYKAVAPFVRAQLKMYIDNGWKFAVTGHSRGAGIATLALFDLASHLDDKEDNKLDYQKRKFNQAYAFSFVFAAPGVGNVHFGNQIHQMYATTKEGAKAMYGRYNLDFVKPEFKIELFAKYFRHFRFSTRAKKAKNAWTGDIVTTGSDKLGHKTGLQCCYGWKSNPFIPNGFFSWRRRIVATNDKGTHGFVVTDKDGKRTVAAVDPAVTGSLGACHQPEVYMDAVFNKLLFTKKPTCPMTDDSVLLSITDVQKDVVKLVNADFPNPPSINAVSV